MENPVDKKYAVKNSRSCEICGRQLGNEWIVCVYPGCGKICCEECYKEFYDETNEVHMMFCKIHHRIRMEEIQKEMIDRMIGKAEIIIFMVVLLYIISKVMKWF